MLRAYDHVTQTRVALKLLRPDAEEEALRRESAALRCAEQPGLVRLVYVGRDLGYPLLAMDLVEGAPFPGVSLPRSWEELKAPLARLLCILGTMHAQGLLHLDLKPNNVRVTPDGAVTLLDLGLAGGPSVSLRRPWRPSGASERYAASEQLLGRPSAPGTDLYAVGVMVYEALTGELPQSETEPRRRKAQRIREAPRPLHLLRPDLPGRVTRTLTTLVGRRLRERPADAWAVLDALGLHAPEPWRSATRSGALLPRAAQETLFCGPQVVLHIPKDAAAELDRRTGGVSPFIDEELRAWVRSGFARVEGSQLTLRRRDLDRLLLGAQTRPTHPASTAEGDARLALSCTLACDPMATRAVLLRALRWTRARLDAALGALAATGDLVELTSGRLRPRRCVHEPLPDALQAALAQALPRGSEPRRRLLVQGPLSPRRFHETLDLAREHQRGGFKLACLAEVHTALRIARRLTPFVPSFEAKALALLADLALSGSSVPLLMSALHEHQRALGGGDPCVEALLHAGLCVLQGEPVAGFKLARATPVGDDRALGERRLAVLYLAAARGPEDTRLAAADEEAEGWLSVHGDEAGEARVLVLRARGAYRRGRFAQANTLLSSALQRHCAVTLRAGALLTAAACAVELGAYARATNQASRAIALAEPRRLHLHEARGHWLLREIACRAGAAALPEPDLLEMARALQDPAITGNLAFTEARLAARSGDRRSARRWAREAAMTYREAGSDDGARLCTAFAASLSDEGDEALLRHSLTHLRGDFSWQIAGLLLPLHAPSAEHVEALTRHVSSLPRPEVSRELFSPAELLEILNKSKKRHTELGPVDR